MTIQGEDGILSWSMFVQHFLARLYYYTMFRNADCCNKAGVTGMSFRRSENEIVSFHFHEILM